jgi:Dolichyl-phosphate-mannose--protein O-mannosyl transferase
MTEVTPRKALVLRRLILSLILVGISAAFIFPNLDRPHIRLYDETFYVPSAQRYMSGLYYLESHPPLARLLITAGQVLLRPSDPADQFVHVYNMGAGEWPASLPLYGYRFFPALFGALIPLALFWVGIEVLRRECLAFAMGLLAALDTALIAQSRAAMPDSIMFFFMLLAFLMFARIWRAPAGQVFRRQAGQWALFAVALAAAVLVKFSMLPFGILVILLGIRAWKDEGFRRAAQLLLVFGAVFLVVYLGVWGIHFSLFTHVDPSYAAGISQERLSIAAGTLSSSPLHTFWVDLRDAHAYIFTYNENIPGLNYGDPNTYASPWYDWLLGGKAIVYLITVTVGVSNQYVVLLSNLVVWLVSLAGVIAAPVALVVDRRRSFLGRNRSFIAIFALTYAVYLGSIAMVHRQMYLYHYFPAMLLGLLLFFCLVDSLDSRYNERIFLGVAALLVLALLFFITYSSLIYYQPIQQSYFNLLNFWRPWGLRWDAPGFLIPTG